MTSPKADPVTDPVTSTMSGPVTADVQSMVREFHAAFGLPVRELPALDVVPPGERALRQDLLREEFDEYLDAEDEGDLVAVADALADMVYVIFGTAVDYGIDLHAVIAEVHRSNMSKLDADGRPVLRADGKVLKSDRFSAPRIADVLGVPSAGRTPALPHVNVVEPAATAWSA